MNVPDNAIPVTVGGVTYPSISQAARACGANPSTVHARLHKGETLEHALRTTKKYGSTSHNAIPVVYDGVSYPSIRALARAHHVTERTAQRRLEDGLPMHAETRGRGTKKSIVHGGHRYTSILELAEASGVDYDRLKHALKTNDVDAALHIAAAPTCAPAPIKYGGFTFPTMKDVATHYGLHPSTAHSRLENNIPLETPIGARANRHPVTVFGITYPSKAALARAFGMSAVTLNSRLRAGDTLERAVRPVRSRNPSPKGDTPCTAQPDNPSS